MLVWNGLSMVVAHFLLFFLVQVAGAAPGPMLGMMISEVRVRGLKPWEMVWRVVVLEPGDGNPRVQVHGVFRNRRAAEQEAMRLKEQDPVSGCRAEPWDPYIQQIVDGRPEQGELQWSKTIVFKGDGRCYCMDVSGPPIPLEEVKVKRRIYRVAHQDGVFYWHCAPV